MKRNFAFAALAIGLLALPACGLTGDLSRPGPLIGSPTSDSDPASLPGSDRGALPPLPERQPAETAPEEEDELLGGPGS